MPGLYCISALLFVCSLTAAITSPGCDMQRTKEGTSDRQSSNSNTAVPGGVRDEQSEQSMSALRVLAEGAYADIEQPFFAIVRERTVYQALRSLVRDLPEISDSQFEDTAVVAAFAGRRSTGGYSVDISRAPDGSIRITELSPPRGSIVTQALSSPFKIVSVKVGEEPGNLKVVPGLTWQSAGKKFTVTSGTFTMSGGLAGKSETYPLKGRIVVWRGGTLVTLQLELLSEKTSKERRLSTIASGTIDTRGSFILPRMDAGSLIEPPAPVLNIEGTISEDAKRMVLRFSSVAGHVADAFMGQGTVEASSDSKD
jgi:hypothetical protein